MKANEICGENCCTGCALCAEECPKRAITMGYTDEGFYVPEVDNRACINCGKCKKVCSEKARIKKNDSVSDYYMSWAKDSVQRVNGTSGGVFGVIGKYVLERGGAVIGAAFNNDLELQHIVVRDVEDLRLLYGSKYIQSETEGIYKIVKKLLNEGTLVLFSGTPCQIAAVYSYCGHVDNLITCDLVCYGVGSTAYLKSYLQELEIKHKGKVKQVKFRNKRYGQRNSSFEVIFDNKSKYESMLYIDGFGYPFSHRLINRMSCYNCPYADSHRTGDLTLGDYTAPDMFEQRQAHLKKGISLLRVNTDKGRVVFDQISSMLTSYKKDERYILRNAVRQNNECVDTHERDRFLREFCEYGFDYVDKRYRHVTTTKKLLLRYDIQYAVFKNRIKKFLHLCSGNI